MEGFPGNTPIIVKNINSTSIQIISLEDFFKKTERKNSNIENWKIWSPDGWNKILEIKKDKTNLKIFRISNCYNWIYATENINFLIGIRKRINIKEIKKDTNLFVCDYLEHTIENIQEDKNNFLSKEEFGGSNRIKCLDFCDIQKKLLTGNFLDFHMKIDCANIPDYVCYNSSMEEYIKNINKEFPPQWYRNYKRNKAKHTDLLREKYHQYLKDFFPREYLNRQLIEIDNIYWDIPPELENETSDYLKTKYINFDRENSYIYNLKTEKKFFNIGAGQLVVCENSKCHIKEEEI